MNAARKTFQLAQLGARQMSVSRVTRIASEEVPAGYTKMKAKQERFQTDDGLPVHLKGGMLDKIMYQTTMALSALGLGLTIHLIYDLATPKS